MATARDVVLRLHEHRLWTRLRIVEAASRLDPEALGQPFPIGPGSLLELLHHLYGAEHVWLDALEGTVKPGFPELDAAGGLPALLRRWSDLDDRWGAFLGRLGDADLDRLVSRTNRAGVTSSTSAGDILLHVCTHAMYHAAQAVNMLRQLGAEPLPETNLITMAREQSAPAPA